MDSQNHLVVERPVAFFPMFCDIFYQKDESTPEGVFLKALQKHALNYSL